MKAQSGFGICSSIFQKKKVSNSQIAYVLKEKIVSDVWVKIKFSGYETLLLVSLGLFQLSLY